MLHITTAKVKASCKVSADTQDGVLWILNSALLRCRVHPKLFVQAFRWLFLNWVRACKSARRKLEFSIPAIFGIKFCSQTLCSNSRTDHGAKLADSIDEAWGHFEDYVTTLVRKNSMMLLHGELVG